MLPAPGDVDLGSLNGLQFEQTADSVLTVGVRLQVGDGYSLQAFEFRVELPSIFVYAIVSC